MPDINVNKLSEALNTKADIDLNNTGVFSTSSGGVNLTSSTPNNASGKEVTSADFIKSDIQSNLLNYTTNRILEIPQDIKWRTDLVETDKKRYRLTILKGSVYYVPQGFEADGVTRKFSKRVTINDNTCDDGFWSDNVLHEEFVFLIFKDNKVVLSSTARVGSNITSGETAPTTFLNNRALWYDTKNNYVKFTEDSGATWYNCSLPLLKGSPRITIDETHPIAGWVNGPTHVFNGFGYIGSTVFVLPGVKCLATNGIDNIGRALSNNYVTNNVLIRTIAKTAYDTTCVLDCDNNKLTTRYNFVISDTKTMGLNGVCRYTPAYNQYIYDENTIHSSVALFDFKANDNGEITSITSHYCPTFVTGDAINFNNSGRALLTSLGMPSGRYIDLTLGASGSTYTAPANGWFWFSKIAGTNLFGVGIENKRNGMIIGSDAGAPGSGNAVMPVLAGDNVVVRYSATGETLGFRFIYAQGDQ